MGFDIVIRSIVFGKTGLDRILTKTRSEMKEIGINFNIGDRVAIVTDLDLRYSENEIGKMKEKCGRFGIELYVSNPCYEVWLLQHFRRFDRPSNPKDLPVYLEDELDGHYNKSDFFDWDLELVERAIRNATSLFGADCDPVWCVGHNPSTNVHLLV